MAVTVSRTRAVRPVERYTVSDITFDSAYLTDGESLTATQLGLSRVDAASATIKTAAAGATTSVYYDVAAAKLLAYTASAQVANDVDLSGVVVQIIAIGA